MKREDDQQLWDLLGRAAEPELSPFFARNVLRQIRLKPRPFERARSWLSWRRLIPVSGVAVAVIAAALFAHISSLRHQPVKDEPDVIAKVDPQDYEVVADLDDLLASDETGLWDEHSSL